MNCPQQTSFLQNSVMRGRSANILVRRSSPATSDTRGQVCPMPLAFEVFHPGGMDEHSPAFQRWEGSRMCSSPVGTVDPGAFQSCLRDLSPTTSPPSVETLGYCWLSLRDIPTAVPPNPGGIGQAGSLSVGCVLKNAQPFAGKSDPMNSAALADSGCDDRPDRLAPAGRNPQSVT